MEEIINLAAHNQTENTTAAPPLKKSDWRRFLLIKILPLLLILLTLVGTLAFFLIFLPYREVNALLDQGQKQTAKLKQSLDQKDFNLIASDLDHLDQLLDRGRNSYRRLSYLKIVPYFKNYYQDTNELLNIGSESLDAANIVLKAIKPYQDFLGFKGSATDSAKTTEDRIAFLTQSIESLLPHLDTIENKIANIENSLNQIDPDRYPDDIRGFPAKNSLLKARQSIAEIHKFVRDGKPILSQTAWLLGKNKPVNYFLIFQNDAELRPSGGFWTAYGTLKVDNGKITPGISDDIYTLDAKFNSTIPAPRPLKAYHLNVAYLNLRDLNLSPDFPTDIKEFLKYYRKINPGDKIDAVIALDTQVLVDIVKVLGRVGVFGYGNFSADPDKRCDGCPQIIYQLEWIAGRPRNYIESNRKGFLGPLMHSLLSNAMGSEKSKITPLVQAFLTNIYQKHILFYFLDPELQTAAEKANLSGKINQTESNVDYFHLNDANMASAKSNIFIRQKIKHEIVVDPISRDQVEHKISVTYTNPSRASNCNLEKGDLCLNAPKYRNWFRFYTPKGSQMVKMTGSEVEPVVYEELDKQVFEGFYGNKYPLYAQSSTKTSIQYNSPVKPDNNYTLLLQKQPGTHAIEYEIYVNGRLQEKFDWVADKTIKLSF